MMQDFAVVAGQGSLRYPRMTRWRMIKRGVYSAYNHPDHLFLSDNESGLYLSPNSTYDLCT